MPTQPSSSQKLTLLPFVLSTCLLSINGVAMELPAIQFNNTSGAPSVAQVHAKLQALSLAQTVESIVQRMNEVELEIPEPWAFAAGNRRLPKTPHYLLPVDDLACDLDANLIALNDLNSDHPELFANLPLFEVAAKSEFYASINRLFEALIIRNPSLLTAFHFVTIVTHEHTDLDSENRNVFLQHIAKFVEQQPMLASDTATLMAGPDHATYKSRIEYQLARLSSVSTSTQVPESNRILAGLAAITTRASEFQLETKKMIALYDTILTWINVELSDRRAFTEKSVPPEELQRLGYVLNILGSIAGVKTPELAQIAREAQSYLRHVHSSIDSRHREQFLGMDPSCRAIVAKIGPHLDITEPSP